MRRILLVLALVLGAGCAQPDRAEGGPGASGTSAEGASSAPSSSPGSYVAEPEWGWNGTWVAHTRDCGFCPPDAESTMAAVDVDGQAMLVAYRAGPSSAIQFSNGTGGWRPYVQPVFELLGNGSTNGVEVVRVQARDIPAGDWAAVAQEIRDGLSTARDPQPKGGPMVADGGYERLWAEGRRATLGDNDDGGGGWSGVADTMDTVRRGFAAQG